MDQLQAYYEFLERKIDAATTEGLRVVGDNLHPSTKPHQRDATQWMLRNGRGLIAASFGLGKTVYCALELDRRGLGTELSEQYYGDSITYAEQIEARKTAPSLFDVWPVRKPAYAEVTR